MKIFPGKEGRPCRPSLGVRRQEGQYRKTQTIAVDPSNPTFLAWGEKREGGRGTVRQHEKNRQVHSFILVKGQTRKRTGTWKPTRGNQPSHN